VHSTKETAVASHHVVTGVHERGHHDRHTEVPMRLIGLRDRFLSPFILAPLTRDHMGARRGF
jgi:hypothetical protein